MNNIFKHIAGLLMGFICGGVVAIVPFVLLNHKHLDLVFAGLNWQKITFIYVCIISAAVLHMPYSPFGQKKEKVAQYLFTLLYLCSYTTCSALCEKLNVTVINLPTLIMGKEISDSSYSGSDYSIVSTVGLVLVVTAVMIEIYRGVRSWLRDKTILCRSDWNSLVFMAGVSLLFSVWLPLLALPGAAVVLKWTTKSTAKANIN